MKTPRWIIPVLLIALVVAILLVATRERFSPNNAIKAPPYDQAENQRIWDLLGSELQDDIVDQVVIMRNANNTPTDGTNLEQRQQIADYNRDSIGYHLISPFYEAKFADATTPITEADISSWVEPRIPKVSKEIDKKILKKYFIEQPGASDAYVTQTTSSDSNTTGSNTTGTPRTRIGSTNTMTNDMPRPTAENSQLRMTLSSYMGIPTNSNEDITKYANVLIRFYDEEYLPDKRVPTSDQISQYVDSQMDVPMEKKPGMKGVIDYWFTNGIPESSSSSNSDQTSLDTGESTSGPAGRRGWSNLFDDEPENRSGGSGGGSTGGVPKQSVFGPKWTALGDSSAGAGGDSTKTSKYPELLGGVGGKKVEPEEDKLPNAWSLGTAGASRFLPFSRQPGDMDMIPDPYRVSKTFMPSSYSSKTDPVPYLNDFSAFFK